MCCIAFFKLFFVFWIILLFSPRVLPDSARRACSFLLPVGYVVALLLGGSNLIAWERLWLSTIGLLFVLKSALLLKSSLNEIKALPRIGLLLFMTIWPGFDLTPFRQNRCTRAACAPRKQISNLGAPASAGITHRALAVEEENGVRFNRGYFCFVSGILLLALLSALAPQLSPLMLGWFGTLALLLIIHCGYADMLTAVMRWSGWNVQPLFDQPLGSQSLREFWSKRWNLAFVEMDKRLFLPMMPGGLSKTGMLMSVFLISGVLHELAVSFPAGSGWGGPFAYFCIQAAGILLERHAPFLGAPAEAGSTAGSTSADASKTLFNRIWTFAWVLLPLPLLFHEAFRVAFIVAPYMALHTLIAHVTPISLLSLAIWCAGIGNFCTLGAGLQVPFRFHWKEDLAKISSFNRKIFLNYAAYVGLIIVALGTFTLMLHDELLRGDRSALCLAVFMAVFWGLRVLVDAFYFKDELWPVGPQFVIGHALLKTLFIAMTGTYVTVIGWHWLLAPLMR